MNGKRLSKLLALILLISVLTGCSANQTPQSSAPEETPSATPTTTPTEAPTEEPSPSPSPSPSPEPAAEPDQPPVDELGENWAAVGETGREYLTYTYAGQTVYRWFSYYIPTSYEPGDQLPLMLTLHGSTSNAAMQMSDGDWVRYAEQEGFILLAPESVAIHADGTLSSEGKSMGEIQQSDMSMLRWAAAATDPQTAYGVDDVEYLCRLVDFFIDGGYADASRVYACGLSHGAYMSLRLAVEAPEKFAGVGIASGQLCYQFQDADPLPATKIVFFQGTADYVVPITGIANWSMSLEETVQWFLDKYGMENNPVETEMPDLAEDGMTTTRYEYDDAEGNAMIVSYITTGGGHAWPGGKFASFSGGTTDINATELIWEELKDVSKDAE